MDIAGIKSMVSMAGTEAMKKRSEVQSATDTKSADTNTTDVYSSKLADIASRYDVENITPRQMVAMENELYSNGLISEKDYALTILHYNKPSFSASYPGELDRPDEPRNMLGDFKAMVSYMKTHDIERNSEGVKNGQHIEDGLEVLDFLHDNKEDSNSSTATTSANSTIDVQRARLAYESDKYDPSKSTADPQKVIQIMEALSALTKEKTGPS